MRDFDLPSPNIGAKGHHLRRIAAAAISYIQVTASNHAGGLHPSASALRAFFSACADNLAVYDASTATENNVAVPTFTPTAKTYSIAAGATAGPVLNKDGHPGVVTYSSGTPANATVNAATGVITPLVAGTSVITASIAAAPGWDAVTKTYTATVEA